MWTPGQSGTCSPAIPAGADHTADVPMREAISMSDEFAFGSYTTGLVKPWEGERIHEDCGSDDLELTLGSSKTRFVAVDFSCWIHYIVVHFRFSCQLIRALFAGEEMVKRKDGRFPNVDCQAELSCPSFQF